MHAIDSGELKPLSSVLDLTDGSMKLRNAHPSMAQHHQSLGRSIFLKRSRHYYGHQYSRRNSANFANASTSRGKGTSHDDNLSFKMATQGNSDSGRLSGYIFFIFKKDFPFLSYHFMVFNFVKALFSKV